MRIIITNFLSILYGDIFSQRERTNFFFSPLKFSNPLLVPSSYGVLKELREDCLSKFL